MNNKTQPENRLPMTKRERLTVGCLTYEILSARSGGEFRKSG